MKLMTAGYEGLRSEEFFDILLSGRVQKIVDLRELPLSRKPGFSKSVLAISASKHKLEYVHIPALGCPREIRHDYRADNNWKRYTRRFVAYLNTQDATIQELADLIQHERCCLLCFESDPNCCHRSFVAQRLATFVSSPLTIVHLKASSPTKVGRLSPLPA